MNKKICIRFMFGVNVERPVTISHKFFYSFHSLAISRQRPNTMPFANMQSRLFYVFIYRDGGKKLNGIFAGMLEQRKH